MKEKQLWDAFGAIDERYLEIAEKTTAPQRRISLRRTAGLILAAAICLSLLAVTAVAAGWVPSIFELLQEQFPEETVYAQAAQASQTQIPEVVELPKMDASKFVLSQSYYDGQTILLGYNLEEMLPEPVVGYQVDEALLREIKGTSQSFEGIDRKTYEENFGPLPEYVQEHSMKRDALAMEGELRQILSPEAYEKMWKLLLQNGSVCVVTQDLFVGDHKLVNGVDTIAAMADNPGAIGMMDMYTEAGTCIYLNPLPEAAQNQSSVTVELKVKSGFQYWYLELEGHGYKAYAPNQEQSISFTLDNVQETTLSAKED